MSWQNLFRRAPATIVGYIEHADRKTIRGWAWNAQRPHEHLSLEVFVGGLYAGRARTGQFRDDLRRNCIGDGCHAFVFHVPPALRTAKIALDGVEILFDGAPATRLGKIGSGKIVKGAEALPNKLDPAAFFRPLVESLALTSAPVRRDESGERRQIDQMLSRADGHEISALVLHLARKHERPEADSDESLWDWYLGRYGLEKGPARVPLSTSDIEALLARQHGRDRSWRLGPASNGTPDLYEWAVNQARRLYVEDCLVSPSDRDHLRQVPRRARSTDFPLSIFMRRFRESSSLLRHYESASLDGRINIYALFMLFALREVHFLAYMPTRWLQDMLNKSVGESPFERAQAKLLGSSVVMGSDLFCRHCRGQGFDIGSQSFFDTSYRRNRIPNGNRVLSDANPVDVQLIGPFTRRLGLAESCRRLAVALQSTGRSLNLCDFDTGAASSVVETDLPIGPPRAARINILHVNAEEVPEVLAFFPDCFSRSQTVLVPYWELDRPASVHELGLKVVDEIWVTTSYLAKVFSAAGKPVTKIGMSFDDRPAVSRQEGRALMASLGVATDRFVFLATSDAYSWARRKNVLGAIEAFQTAFASPDAIMVVKTRHASAQLSPLQQEHWREIRAKCEADPRIVLVDADLSDREQRALLAGCDCLVSLHRAEGLGLDILDSLARGTPVVATAYSGNMDFCDHNSSWLVDYALSGVNIEDYAFAEPGHVWAEPDVESAITALRNVRHDEHERTARARFAAERTQIMTSLPRFSARLSHEIDRRLGPLPRSGVPMRERAVAATAMR